MRKTLKIAAFVIFPFSIMVLFEIHQRLKGHSLNELRVSFKIFKVTSDSWISRGWGGSRAHVIFHIQKREYPWHEEWTNSLLNAGGSWCDAHYAEILLHSISSSVIFRPCEHWLKFLSINSMVVCSIFKIYFSSEENDLKHTVK